MKCPDCGHSSEIHHVHGGCTHERDTYDKGYVYCKCDNSQAQAELLAAEQRITTLEKVCISAEKELRIASELPDLSPRNKVEFSNAANMLLAVLQDIP